MKLAVITGFLGKTKDRFHEYNKELDLDGKFALLKSIPGYSGVEVVYPYETPAPAELKSLLAKHGLSVAAINVNVKGEPEFRNGGLTSLDPVVRAKAVRFLKEAKDYAAAVGADKVTCCPLGDGYEFAFQYDYATAWKSLVSAFAEAAAHRPEITLFIEYKPSETRGTCFVNSASKTVCLVRDAGTKGLGITLDFGHSVYGGENPAEAVALVHGSGIPLYVHINDNDGKWDWDYFCGTKHYLEYVEFIWQLRRIGYDGWFTSDTSPTRWDIAGTFEANARLSAKIERLLDAIDATAAGKAGSEKTGSGKAGSVADTLTGLVSKGDYLSTWRFVESRILGLGE
jgi:xylose isomerase